MAQAPAKKRKVRNTNGLLDKALLNHGVLDAFRAMSNAAVLASSGRAGGDVTLTLSRWVKEAKAQGLNAQLCIDVVMGNSITETARKHRVGDEKALNNLVSCLLLYRSIRG